MSSISSDNEDVGLVPAKKAREEMPVQIDTSTIKVAATIKKVTKPIAKPKTKATAVVDEESIMDNDNESDKSERTTKSTCGARHKHCVSGNCDGKLVTGTNWATHVERKHTNGTVSYNLCTGASCIDCRQGKYNYTFCTRTSYFLYPDLLLFVPGPLTFCTR